MKQVNNDKATGVLAKARMLLEGGLQEEGNITDKGTQDPHKHVLLAMRKYAAYKSLKEDTLILQFGNVCCENWERPERMMWHRG